MNQARASLLALGLPEKDWTYAEEATVHVLNYTPREANPNSESPHERFSKGIGLPEEYHKPPIKTLRTWGARAYVHVAGDKTVRPQGRKMMAKAVLGRLYGYEGTHGRVYLVRLDKSGKVVRVRDVTFHEEDDNQRPDKTLLAENEYFADFEEEAVDEEDQGLSARVVLTHKTAAKPTPKATANSTAPNEAIDDSQKRVESIADRDEQIDYITPPPEPMIPGQWVQDQTVSDFVGQLSSEETAALQREGVEEPPEQSQQDNASSRPRRTRSRRRITSWTSRSVSGAASYRDW